MAAGGRTLFAALNLPADVAQLVDGTRPPPRRAVQLEENNAAAPLPDSRRRRH